MRSWERYGRDFERGPRSSFGAAFKIGTGVILLAFSLGLVGQCTGFIGGTIKETKEVIREEFGPRALLQKYEWFKDAAAQLEKKQADMKVYDSRFQRLEEAYKGQTRKDWARDDREQWSLWQSEAAGVRASYNGLAADYNAQMAKFNWRFCNAGDLPQGATVPLPREFKPYEEGR